MSSDVVNLDAVSAGLKAIKNLRCSVNDLFRTLTDGIRGLTTPAIAGSNQNETDPNEAAEKQFLSDVQGLINSINTRIRDIETSCTLLAHPTAPVSVTLGNTAHLGQDPAYERTNLYSSLISAYRWSDKMHEYSSHAQVLLSQNALKRSIMTNSPMQVRMRLPGAILPRRQTYIGHNIPLNQVDNFCHSLQRLSNDLTIEVLRPFGAPTVLKITLERVLKAVILLRGLIIEWVVVKALSEDFQSDDGKLDIWSESRYEVFRKISDHANAAMLHFSSPIHVDLAIKSFITWLHSYNTLFSKPCRRCETRLLNAMPPTWRDYRTLESFHEPCRP